ncbi:integrin beta-1-B-like isoform X1 [Clavelina lepadiformis]|uniref:integrin beta-1-B-like isoform X1 n=1 Tax=Clavelina lepadiformis TaxID=159417 RepID=UPI0040436839
MDKTSLSVVCYIEMTMLFLLLTLCLVSCQMSEADISRKCAAAQDDCGQCISAHPSCSWCVDDQDEHSQVTDRCRTAAESTKACANFINPVFIKQETRNMEFSVVDDPTATNVNVIQVKPQEQNVKLRIGETAKVNITFKKVVESPLDIYYTMDLSLSMSDDLEYLKTLAVDLVDHIQSNVTNNIGVGFGTFVDKVVLPYASEDQAVLDKVCGDDQTCQLPFGFRHQLSITGNSTNFEGAVLETVISANLDTPEGGFDALMQIAVCENIIGWRPGALRVILLTSDAISHSAMDGKLGGILDANDMACHLIPEASGHSHIYSKSQEQDYPSIGQLKEVFQRNKIQAIFAVTNDTYDAYKDFPNLLPSYVGVLDGSSRNIFPIISNAYDQIKSQFAMTAPIPPEGLEMNHRTLCPRTSTWKENSLECDNIALGDEITFQFDLLATACPNILGHVDKVEFISSFVQDVVSINIDYHCDCDCAVFDSGNSSSCNNHGDLMCGVCQCSDGKGGSHCQCDTSASNSELLQSCTDQSSSSEALCNNHGLCECGACECEKGFFGNLCQCKSSDCPTDEKGLECGGELQGHCENCYGDRRCICNETGGWTLNKANSVCSCHDDKCKAHPGEEVCNGNGDCICDTCECYEDSFYWTGRYCNQCVHPDCSNLNGTCSNMQLLSCADCVYKNGRVDSCLEYCEQLGIESKTLTSLPDCKNCAVSPSEEDCNHCNSLNEDLFSSIVCERIQENDQCLMSYKIGWDNDRNNFVVLIKTRNVLVDCPQPIEPIIIIMPVVGTILIGGIIAMLVWRHFKTKWDKKKYEEFLNEISKSKWNAVDNPIHQTPAQRFVNPNYIESDDFSLSKESKHGKPDLLTFMQTAD